MNKFRILLIIAILCPLGLFAQSFTYNYKGVNFSVKIKDGKTIIRAFDRDAAKVVIPARVVDEKGKEHQVSVVDLISEARKYKTNTVVIEPGIVEIGKYCFCLFNNLSAIYIPNSIEKIGKNAFNPKHAPSFTMPSSIKEEDLLAGNAVYPKVSITESIDPLANVDLSDYGHDTEDSPPKEADVQSPSSKAIMPGTSDIDYNIPTTNSNRDNTFCIIIANELYKHNDTPNVKYAAQDGKTFLSYCTRTLGLPKDNVRFVSNASYLQMKSLLEWLKQIGDVYGKDANFIVYYAGHGVPDEKGNCKLIPSDVSINDVNNGFGLKELYSVLGNITSSSVLVLIDACFSGNDREDIAAVDDMHRGIVREVKKEDVTGDVVVLTAASGTETALSYDEKAHGLFSYYLMKKLQETKGDVTFGALYDYIKKEVMRKSIVSKGKKQTPSVTYSSKMQNNWKNLKL
ncbi:MAG: caspase family protein [Bacillus sp. (in: firmicutes)]